MYVYIYHLRNAGCSRLYSRTGPSLLQTSPTSSLSGDYNIAPSHSPVSLRVSIPNSFMDSGWGLQRGCSGTREETGHGRATGTPNPVNGLSWAACALSHQPAVEWSSGRQRAKGSRWAVGARRGHDRTSVTQRDPAGATGPDCC